MSEENSRAVVELFVKVNIDEFTVFEFYIYLVYVRNICSCFVDILSVS
jgi:hypothetical protein